MTRTCKTPAVKAGASRDSFAGLSRSLSSLDLYRAQFPILTAHCGAERMVILAATAFGEGQP